MLRGMVVAAAGCGGGAAWYFANRAPPCAKKFNAEQDEVYDVVVVGAGVVGLATAREILMRHKGMKVAVLDKEQNVAGGQSGHNSGVIHAGMYYQPGSDIAQCCVQGVKMLYDYAEKKNIPHKRVGKLIVATNVKEDETVQQLYDTGVANGVKDLAILTGPQVRAIEPNVVCTSALLSPNTGIIDYKEVAKSLASDVQSMGGKLVFDFEVNAIEKQEVVAIGGCEPRQFGPQKTVYARHLITCAGLWMDRLAELAPGPDPASESKVCTFRGTYYQLKPEYRKICTRNIYPVPKGGGIPTGVHLTPTVNVERGEQMLVGPGAAPCMDTEGYLFYNFSFSYVWNKLIANPAFLRFAMKNMDLAFMELFKDVNRTAFLNDVRRFVPSLQDHMVEPSFTGVMAQVFVDDGKAASHFLFTRKALDGTTLHLRAAPSPGATACLALGRLIADYADEDFKLSASRRLGFM